MNFCRKILCVVALMPCATAAVATIPAVPPTIDICKLPGKDLMQFAIKRSYIFSVAESRGDATCRIERGGEILIVSARADKDGSCTFSMFKAQPSKITGVLRFTMKERDSGNISFHSRGVAAGDIAVSIAALRGVTTHHRMLDFETASVKNRCVDAEIGNAYDQPKN